jgi:NADH-quinone oxidoreductase subunit M
VGAAFGVILAAVYMLSVVQRVFFGKLSKENRGLSDISPRETLAVAPFIVMIFVIGFFPNLFLNRSEKAVDQLGNHLRVVSGALVRYSDDNLAKMLPEGVIPSPFLEGAPEWEAPEEPNVLAAAPAAAGQPVAAPRVLEPKAGAQ